MALFGYRWLLTVLCLVALPTDISIEARGAYRGDPYAAPTPYKLNGNEHQPAKSDAFRFSTKRKDSSLEFFAVGDWGCRPQGGTIDANQKKVIDSMVSYGTQPNFILALGDNFYEHGIKSTKDPRWKTVFEDAYQRMNDTPWYAVVGNHDWRAGTSGIQAQVDYTQKSKRWKMPYSYHRQPFEVDSGVKALFVFLDTTKIIDGDKPQLDWLKDVLAKANEQYVVVVGHHPVISASDHGNLPWTMQHLYPLFNEYHVDLYVAGHDHVVEHLKDGNVHYYVCGSGCKLGTMKQPIPQLLYGEAKLGFCKFKITASEIFATIVGEGGKVLEESAIPRRRT